ASGSAFSARASRAPRWLRNTIPSSTSCAASVSSRGSDDELGAALGRLLEEGGGHRVVLGRIGADDHMAQVDKFASFAENNQWLWVHRQKQYVFYSFTSGLIHAMVANNLITKAGEAFHVDAVRQSRIHP